jgi:hypothetical protein
LAHGLTAHPVRARIVVHWWRRKKEVNFLADPIDSVSGAGDLLQKPGILGLLAVLLVIAILIRRSR